MPSLAYLLARFAETVTVTRQVSGLLLVFSAPFVAGNQISLLVNNTAIAPVDFTTDSPTTLEALASAIAAVPGVQSAISDGNLTITVQQARSVAITNVLVAGGASQPTASLTGGWINGAAIPNPPQALVVSATVQPLSGHDLLILPEGERTTERIWLYTDTELQTASGAQGTTPDVVTWRGIQYQVQRVDRWQETALAHFRAMAVRIPQQMVGA